MNPRKWLESGKTRWSIKKLISFLIAPSIVAGILLLVYGLKGIYPFGSLTVVYGDMDQHYIPFSYHIYDVFYHGKSLFWDPFLGTGSNIFGIEALSGMFSPISWLVIFTSRENIPHFASFLLMIRLALLSLTSYVFMNRVFPGTRAFWRIALSVMYAFSGYVLIFYTNMPWVDCAILFPLLLVALKNLFDKDRVTGYLVILSINLVVSYYISFMVLLFVFFGSGIFLWFYIEKSRRKKVVTNLGFGTIGALLVTSLITVPAFLQSASSIRFGTFSYLTVIGKDTSESVTLNKALFFFFASAALVVFIRILLNYKKNRKMVVIFVLLMAVTVPQVLVESINLLWYGGSYVCYPYRFGFIPIFVLLAGCAYYFSPSYIPKSDKRPFTIKRVDNAAFKKRPGKRVFQVLFALIALAAFVVAVYLGTIFGHSINRTLYGYWGITENLSGLFMITSALFGIALWILFLMKDRKIKYILLSIVLLTEIFTHSLWYIGVPPRLDEGHIDDWSAVANELHGELTPETDTLSRYKDADSVMNANYPLILGSQSVSSYLHIIRAEQQEMFRRLGYSTNYTRILDTGGTVFSDMVLKVDHVLTVKPSSTELYDLVMQTAGFYVYKSKYTLPAGLIYTPLADGSGAIVHPELADNTSPLKNQNVLYQTLFEKTDNIIELVETPPVYTNLEINQGGERLHCRLTDSGEPGRIEYQIASSGSNYIYLGAGSISNAVRIKVNNQFLEIPTLGNSGGSWFPSSYNNGILNLGLFGTETVKVELILSQDTDFNSFAIGTLSVEKLKALSTQATSSQTTSDNSKSALSIDGNTLRVRAVSDGTGQYLFLPVNADPGWQCLLNGKTAAVDKAFGTFIQVKLEQGVNDIELRFVPKGFKEGALLSAIALLAFLGILFLLKRKRKSAAGNDMENQDRKGIGTSRFLTSFANKTSTAVSIAFWLVYAAAVLFVYILPTLAFAVRNIGFLLSN